jgi:hypothetical protein
MLRPTRPHQLVSLLCCGSLVALGALGCVGSIEQGKSGSGDNGPSGVGPGPGGGPKVDPPPGGGVDPIDPGGSVTPGKPLACAANQLGPTPLHRLTRPQYDNTIRDLIGEDLKLSKEFGFDEKAGEFIANYFTPLTEVQFAQYATAAEAVAERAATNMAKVVPCQPTPDAAACSTQFIKQFGRKAFRRPLDEAEVSRYQGLFEMGRTGLDFANGVRLVVQAMLQSPKFLYIVEGPGALTQHQLAARLSYFIWGSPPDAQLATAADMGQLGTLEALRAQAARLFADQRGVNMVIDFHNQWLGYFAWEMGKDAKVYPEFETLKPSLLDETNRFLADALKTDGAKLETLFTAPYSIVNAPLAAVYGVTPPKGTEWSKVQLDPKERGGLFTQASFLSAHGSYDGSSPIRRGLAIRERIFCAPMPVPPPGADATFPAATPSQTTRQRFDKHRTDPTCASCHQLMDKIGYGYETYDGIGRYRTTENTIPVDDSGELIGSDVDGTFKGAQELSRKLLGSDEVQACVTSQWFRYAFGREETEADKCTLDALGKAFTSGGLKTTDLLTTIVESDAFRSYQPLQ